MGVSEALKNGDDDKTAKLKAKVYEINKIAEEFYHENLYKPTSKLAQEYVKKRKLDNTTLKNFLIGYSNNNYNDLYHIIDTLIDNNYLVTNTTNDRTIMNTDMLNESCILFNNANITLRVYVKEMIMIIKALNLNDSEKDKLIEIITNLSNDIL